MSAGAVPLDPDAMASVFRRHGDREQRRLIAALDGDDRRAFAIVAALCDERQAAAVQRWAMEAVAVFGRGRALPVLRRGLRSRHMSVRLHALAGLASLADRGLCRDIRPLLRDVSGGIRVNALAALAALRPRWLPSAAREALGDEKAYVRKLAQRILDERPRPPPRGRADRGQAFFQDLSQA